MRHSFFKAATIAALVGAVGTAVPAHAADLGTVAPVPSPVTTYDSRPAADWNGFSIGALLGYKWGDADGTAASDVDGVDGGIYAGYDFQRDRFVFGIEADALISGADGSGGGLSVEQDWSGSLRGRAGIALDRFLLYGTGGVAVTEITASNAGGTDSETLWGWTAGAGVEALLTDRVTGRVEYRYSDYEDKTFAVGGAPSIGYSEHGVRAGVGVKF